jgi:hypothetical protein
VSFPSLNLGSFSDHLPAVGWQRVCVCIAEWVAQNQEERMGKNDYSEDRRLGKYDFAALGLSDFDRQLVPRAASWAFAFCPFGAELPAGGCANRTAVVNREWQTCGFVSCGCGIDGSRKGAEALRRIATDAFPRGAWERGKGALCVSTGRVSFSSTTVRRGAGENWDSRSASVGSRGSGIDCCTGQSRGAPGDRRRPSRADRRDWLAGKRRCG